MIDLFYKKYYHIIVFLYDYSFFVTESSFYSCLFNLGKTMHRVKIIFFCILYHWKFVWENYFFSQYSC